MAVGGKAGLPAIADCRTSVKDGGGGMICLNRFSNIVQMPLHAPYF
jgi:hypothetical protein